MSELDYYEVLEVSKDADGGTIKKAYRRLAMKFHPDRNQGDKDAEENFKLVNEAYQVLSDEQKRALYDRYGKAGLENSGYQGFSDRGFDDIFDDLGSVFESVFGSGFRNEGGRKKDSNRYSLDLGVDLNLSFKDAAFGCKKEIEYEYKVPCKDCNGTGAKGGETHKCPECQGRGNIFMKQGFMTFSQTCPECQGAGVVAKEKCKSCLATGYETKKDRFEVEIPEGVDSGNRIRVSERGNIGQNGQRGDLYLMVEVARDEHFIRHGSDIYIEIPVFFTQIPLEAKIKIPSLIGELELSLPKDAEDKQQFTFRGEGIKSINSGIKGNLIAQIKIMFPKKINAEQKELLEKLNDSFGYDSVPHETLLDNVVDKIKNWFSIKEKK